MRRISFHISHNVKRNLAANPTVQGQVMDLRQIGELYKSGTPLSMSNLPETQTFPAEQLDFGSENPTIPDYERRGVDMNDVWQMEKDAQKRLGSFKKRASSYLTSAPTADPNTPAE